MTVCYGYAVFWLRDLKDLFNAPGSNKLILLGFLSRAIHEATRMAESAEHELNYLLRDKEATGQYRARIVKDWDAAREHFNIYIDKWETLFKEINKTTGLNCDDYYTRLNRLDS